jgi:multiple sugar transport system ATP-binding protein
VARLELIDLAVSRGGRPVLAGIDLSVEDGDRLALLGSSGAGKTTLLRTVAGALPRDRGAILLDGTDLAELHETERGIALVAQSASLLPHRDVSGNIGFPLEIRRLRRPEIDRRVRAQARAFSLARLLRRRTRTLSAGQSAEVSLARALVRRTRLLLLDEPFARIGEPVRDRLVRDVLEMQEGYGSTLVVATNDPRVAEQVAPRTAVLVDGRIAQVGTPRELVERPVSLDVAWLVGGGPLNLLPGRLSDRDGTTVVDSGALQLPTWDLALSDHVPAGVQIALRPGDLFLDGEPTAAQIAGRVVHHAFLGSAVDVTVATEDATLLVRCRRPVPPIGARVHVAVPGSAVHLFDHEGRALAHGV